MKLKGNIKVNAYIYNAVTAAQTRFVLSYGGAGSGKSFTQAQIEVINTFGNQPQKILIIRKVAATLIDSCIPLVVEQVVSAMGAASVFEFNKSDRILTNIATGNKILFRGLDDPEKIKSIAGITRIWVEEASELTEADFDQLNLRLRGALNLQMVLTFNPIDENHWLKRRFIDSADPDTTIVKSTYRNNPFIDVAYTRELEKYLTTDYYYYNVYALGNWGKLDTGAEFYKKFSPAQHISETSYNPALPLHLSFDENVNPYLACTVWQATDGQVACIDEVCLRSPANTLAHTLTEITKRYRNHTGGMFIYGDATSRKADTKLEKGHNFFTLIRNGLAQFRPVERVPASNPSVMMRGLFVNDILAARLAPISITIHPQCTNTINDFKYSKEASDGTKLKNKIKDPKTGVPYEPYGHTSDTADYFLTRYFNSEYLAFQRSSTTPQRMALQTHSPLVY